MIGKETCSGCETLTKRHKSQEKKANMAKSVRGIYKDGKIRLPTKELPEVDGELQVIVVFPETDTDVQQLEEIIMTQLGIAQSVVTRKGSPEEEKTFSIAGSSFFSLSPEHLGRTAAGKLDEIIAQETVERE